jgi:hypothetical protein
MYRSRNRISSSNIRLLLCSVLLQQFDDFGVAPISCEIKRCPIPLVPYLHVGTACCIYEQWDSFGTFHLARRPDMEDGVVNAVFLDGQVKTVNRIDSWRYCAPEGQSLSPVKDESF